MRDYIKWKKRVKGWTPWHGTLDNRKTFCSIDIPRGMIEPSHFLSFSNINEFHKNEAEKEGRWCVNCDSLESSNHPRTIDFNEVNGNKK